MYSCFLSFILILCSFHFAKKKREREEKTTKQIFFKENFIVTTLDGEEIVVHNGKNEIWVNMLCLSVLQMLSFNSY